MNRINFIWFKYSFSILILIFAFTFINNYYFYEHITSDNYKNQRVLVKVLNHKIDMCRKYNIIDSECYKDIILITKSINKRNLIIKDEKNSIIYEHTYPYYNATLLSTIITLPLLGTSNVINIRSNHKGNSLDIAFTVYRSMTFSISDIVSIYNKKGISNAFYFMKTIAWYRSRPTIFISLMIILLFLLFRSNQKILERQIRMQEYDLLKRLRKQKLVKKENRTLKSNEKDLLKDINLLKSKNIDIATKMKAYDKIINPPLNAFKFDDIINLDPESIIFKSRKVTEKLLSHVYLNHFNQNDFSTLDVKIKKLYKDGAITKKAQNYAFTIKAFGNISAHMDIENPVVFVKSDALIVSNALLLLIDELISLNLIDKLLVNKLDLSIETLAG